MSVTVIKNKLEGLSVGLRAAIDQYSTQLEYQDWARVWIKDFKEAVALNEPQDEESKEENLASIINGLVRDYNQMVLVIKTEIENQFVENKKLFDSMKIKPKISTKIGSHDFTLSLQGKYQQKFKEELFMLLMKQTDQLIRNERSNANFIDKLIANVVSLTDSIAKKQLEYDATI